MTRRPDQTTVSGHNRDGLKTGPYQLVGREARMVAQLAQILVMLPDAIERERRGYGERRGGGDPPEPIRLKLLDMHQDLLSRNGEFAQILRDFRRELGLSNQVQRLHDYRCPECDCLGLILDKDEWEVWCTACEIRWPVDGTQIAAIMEQQNREVEAG